MSKDLTVTTIQSNLIWHDIQSNLDAFEAKIDAIDQETDLIILPEMFTTGFSMEAEKLAESMSGPTMDWFRQKASDLNAVITGSFICVKNDKYYNRLIWMFPDGKFQSYDKRHLFAYAGEHETYTSGEKRLVVEWKGWRICPQICYDLRFPVWARFTEEQPYDLLIFTANWPEKRRLHWQQLLIARAIENQCYVIGVNRVGEDGKGFRYAGDSAVIDPMGEPIFRAAHQAVTHTSVIELTHVKGVRDRFHFLDDADVFKITAGHR